MSNDIEIAKAHGIDYYLTPVGTREMHGRDDQIVAFADAVRESERAALNRDPLDDAQALALARQHLDKGLSWAPHIVRCTDLEVRALIRAVEAAHGIGG